MSTTQVPPQLELPAEVGVVNVGLPLFRESVASQDRPVVQIDWHIPGGGEPNVVAALRRLYGPYAAPIEQANAEVFARLDRGAPQLTGMRMARDVIPVLAEGKVLLHCGPPITLDRVPDPLRRSMRAAVIAEGWAADPEQADRALSDGSVRLESANVHTVVVPMATAMGPTTPVWEVALPDASIVAHAPLGQGSGDVAWFGRDTPEAVQRLQFLNQVAGPVLAEAVAKAAPIDVMSLAAQAVAMGDDVHVRTQAATNILLKTLLTGIVATEHPNKVDVAQYLADNHLLFLSLAMAAARALTTWAGQVPNSSVVTGLSRNGTDFACWLAGPDPVVSIGQAPMVGRALYKPGRTEADAARDIGDSAVLELVGLGGAAAANSPAVAQLVGGISNAAALTDALDRVAVGRSSRFVLPFWGMRGAPVGIDVRKVVEFGITPQITTGILHNSDGSGQIGAGVAEAPLPLFVDALFELDRRISGGN